LVSLCLSGKKIKPRRLKKIKKMNQPQKNENNGMYSPLPDSIEKTAKLVVDAAYQVHYNLGPGLLEKVYEVCFCHELEKRGLNYKRQIDIPIVYDKIVFKEGLRLDVLVEDCIICELKAIEIVNPR
jgi:GxxExxY protein